MPLCGWLRASGVIACHPRRSRRLIGLQLRIGDVVEFASQHFLFFGLHAAACLCNELPTGWHGYRAVCIERCTNRLGLPARSGLQNLAIWRLAKAIGAFSTGVETANGDVEHRPRPRGRCVATPLLAASVAMPWRQHRYS
ncbi:hypothetical protein XAP6164_2880025 [Xanthomonas phaseoli pv. phaseoli]|nr:hypothetical protein XAP6164_2880025 [Xanthomonas phaseoli pv. phaseoli]